MPARLETALAEAHAALSAAELEELAELVETFVVNRTEPLDFTEAELAELKRRQAEPFEAAPKAEVRAFFDLHRG
ncbi:MAG: hypothetical protein U1E40_06070 [Amaricoccus sp.]